MKRSIITAMGLLLLLAAGCGDDADELGVGATCSANADCNDGQACLTEFKGGYCGLSGCTQNADCPEGSACVVHTNQKNYCFRICVDKPDCNANRPVDLESNCSSSVDYTSGKKEGKACIPPSN